MTGKNIVLLSDGTGNSSAKIFKTNVWRLYQALDLTNAKEQVAYYDDGVGTSSFKPWAMVSGAFGFGLKRNVVDIYSFCCRNYKKGDRIFGFGFSRGAFTMRIVASFIARIGLVKYEDDEAKLAQAAEIAYRQYRKDRKFTAGLNIFVTPGRAIRDFFSRLFGAPRFRDLAIQPVEKIHFLGLWDTVDAYGGPIEEITRAIDYWIWPLSMPDRFMNGSINRACHAMSLEDERDAFRPVVWDERYVSQGDAYIPMEEGWSPPHQPNLPAIDRQRMSQVWFVGVHADVGGGYPQDGLAHFTLDWMIDRTEPYGLHVLAVQRAWIKSLVNRFDKLNDSRHGLAGYYRYKPRKLADIYDEPPYQMSFCEDARRVWRMLSGDQTPETDRLHMRESFKGVRRVDRPPPTIHEAVFERISACTDGYAPIVIPADYRTTNKAGELHRGAVETPDEAMARGLTQEGAWNLVWWRRVVYFLTVLASAFLAAMPLIKLCRPGLGKASPFEFLIPAIDLVGKFLPSFVSPWLEAFKDAPERLVVGGLMVVILLNIGGRLQGTIRDRMRAIWRAPAKTGGEPNDFVHWLRTRGWYRALFYVLKHWLLPSLFAIIMLAALALAAIWIAPAALSRLTFGAADALGFICGGPPGTDVTETQSDAKPFKTIDPCTPTGLRVKKGETYRVTLTIPTADSWADAGIETGPNGFGWDKTTRTQVWGIPIRRLMWSNWFQTVLRVGSAGFEEHAPVFTPEPAPAVTPAPATETTPPHNTYSATFKAHKSGDVYVFVNDSVIGLPWFYGHFYGNNKGAATIALAREPKPKKAE